mmetsp:Transcript_13652/g.20636  ORF Transcript_13652/g.20636 Transcript_13652/m.20636 type:complete len:298 (-) Transcript_13652:82-975(-)
MQQWCSISHVVDAGTIGESRNGKVKKESAPLYLHVGRQGRSSNEFNLAKALDGKECRNGASKCTTQATIHSVGCSGSRVSHAECTSSKFCRDGSPILDITRVKYVVPRVEGNVVNSIVNVLWKHVGQDYTLVGLDRFSLGRIECSTVITMLVELNLSKLIVKFHKGHRKLTQNTMVIVPAVRHLGLSVSLSRKIASLQPKKRSIHGCRGSIHAVNGIQIQKGSYKIRNRVWILRIAKHGCHVHAQIVRHQLAKVGIPGGCRGTTNIHWNRIKETIDIVHVIRNTNLDQFGCFHIKRT